VGLTKEQAMNQHQKLQFMNLITIKSKGGMGLVLHLNFEPFKTANYQ